ncbi:MAG: hypothetical protein HP493_13045, partial [Nitrospira sp.]|nr:hypothetical protein [Nitrospira sp.]
YFKFKNFRKALEFANEVGKIVSVDDNRFIKIVGSEYIDSIKKRILSDPIMVRVDRNYYRPTEVDLLIGDSTKARTKLGWTPEYDLNGLINRFLHPRNLLFSCHHISPSSVGNLY